jgi:hypothetical protein
MDLKSGYPFWAVKNGQMYAFPRLDADLSCDVALVGAGITGALLAYQSRLRAISMIEAVARAVGDVDFAKCGSLYYASNRADRPHLTDEFAWRKQHGITYSMLGAELLRAQTERRRHPLTALFSFARLERH